MSLFKGGFLSYSGNPTFNKHDQRVSTMKTPSVKLSFFNRSMSQSKPNPNYPSKTGRPSGKGRGNTPKSGGKGGSKSSKR